MGQGRRGAPSRSCWPRWVRTARSMPWTCRVAASPIRRPPCRRSMPACMPSAISWSPCASARWILLPSGKGRPWRASWRPRCLHRVERQQGLGHGLDPFGALFTQQHDAAHLRRQRGRQLARHGRPFADGGEVHLADAHGLQKIADRMHAGIDGRHGGRRIGLPATRQVQGIDRAVRAERGQQLRERAPRLPCPRDADQRRQLVEPAASGYRVVDVQLPVAAVEIRAPQARRGPRFQNISDAPGGATFGACRAGMWSPVSIAS